MIEVICENKRAKLTHLNNLGDVRGNTMVSINDNNAICIGEGMVKYFQMLEGPNRNKICFIGIYASGLRIENGGIHFN